MKKRWIAAAAGAALVVAGAAVYVIREDRIAAAECDLVASLDAATAAPIGTGESVTIIGDSYTQGFGLDDPRTSWVSYLPDRRATVSASSGAGFTRDGLCDSPSLSELTESASGPLILQGGLNDVGGDMKALERTIDDLLSGNDVLVLVGPTRAPAFDADEIADVVEVLSEAAKEHGVPYLDATEWDLPFSDGIHLTADGHAEFGGHVASSL
ncbi:hypothetical protein CJ226_09200 [Microbacterium sp. UMB0228]|uniref:SGNH/GDSL hydrolase family protein n=1 Tax=Microbacterium sp. UMB0228 TaxID=2029109 RepID=UPI000C810458|nr:SGNH/GDSL hydrolase family protein [Microbacterium sp. UMB0228]PMC04171.1 hypothetical protein CJ226_09200 [Microbacterium sp. UMB0228]